MSELVEFLLARIAEDEQRARDNGADAMMGARWKHAPENVYQELQRTVLDNSKRILAECEAKRRIVEEHRPAMRMHDHPVRKSWRGSSFQGGVAGCSTCGDGLCPTLFALATVYAVHHDYDEAWRP